MSVGGTQDIFYRRDSIVPMPFSERADAVYMWDGSSRHAAEGRRRRASSGMNGSPAGARTRTRSSSSDPAR